MEKRSNFELSGVHAIYQLKEYTREGIEKMKELCEHLKDTEKRSVVENYLAAVNEIQDWSSDKKHYKHVISKRGAPGHMYELGDIYVLEENVEMPYIMGGFKEGCSKAVELYRKAIQKGDVASMTRLGKMYVSGYGVRQSYLEAKNCIKRP